MFRRRPAALFAVVVSASLALAACGGGSDSDSEGEGGAKADAAIAATVNTSDAKGGTIRYVQTDDWDSVDPGDTYYALSWNFIRLYGRPLVTFKPASGDASNELVPDLAESLGKSSNGGKTWTYTLRDGVKFEDGTPVTSKDVEYGVSRSLDKEVFPNGPTYFNDWLDLKGYKGPYKDKGKDNPAIDTPDDKTIVFNLVKPFSGFDYFAQLPSTIPVPAKEDTGTKYREHVISTGPYKFDTAEVGKEYTLSRNENWDKATDPIRSALPDKITVALKVNADDVDNRLLAGDADMDVAGSGVQAAAQAKILQDPKLRENSDIIPQARLNYIAVHPDVAPLDNVDCRKAVMWATDKTALQRAYGGDVGGSIASNLMPPTVAGAQAFDTYATPDNKGDLDKAKAALQACGQPNGFETSLSYRGERPKEKASAEAMQQQLAKVGIKLTLKSYPAGDYFALYAGNNAFVKRQNIGLSTMAWGADWNDGFGFLSQIVDPRVIRPNGNTNLGVTDETLPATIDKAIAAPDQAAREQGWVDVDKQVMDGAYIIPGTWGKGLFYRPPNVTNVSASYAWGMYDYLNLGVTAGS